MATYNIKSLSYGSDIFKIDPANVHVIETTITNASGSYSGTVQDPVVMAYMKPIYIEFGNPSIFKGDIEVTSSDGYITIACSSIAGTSTVKVTLLTGNN